MSQTMAPRAGLAACVSPRRATIFCAFVGMVITRFATPAAASTRCVNEMALLSRSVATMVPWRLAPASARVSASSRRAAQAASSCLCQPIKPQCARSRPGARSSSWSAASNTMPPPAQCGSTSTSGESAGWLAAELAVLSSKATTSFSCAESATSASTALKAPAFLRCATWSTVLICLALLPAVPACIPLCSRHSSPHPTWASASAA